MMMTIRKAAQTLCATMLCMPMAWAQNAPDLQTPPRTAPPVDRRLIDDFSAYRESYVLLNQMRNNGWAARDEAAARVQYSFKYTWNNQSPATSFEEELLAQGIEVFSSYTGMFDFYAGTRDSGPVINRTSNLGFLHVRIPGQKLNLDRTALEISLEHRSDGQVFEPTTSTGSATAQQNYASADSEARHFFDTLSRGSNYLGLQASWAARPAGHTLHLRAGYHLYLSQNSEITWGPLKDSGRTIRNYDLLTLQAALPTDRHGTWSAVWRLGSSGLATDSLDLSWQAPWRHIPLYARIHLGPMNTLSNYTQRQDSLGIGLVFADPFASR